MAKLYEQIGRLVVRLVWTQYGREIRLAAGIGVIAALAGGYIFAKREPPEG